jgi:hypothetical protein
VKGPGLHDIYARLAALVNRGLPLSSAFLYTSNAVPITGGQTTITGLQTQVLAGGVYRFYGLVKAIMGATSSTVGYQFTGPSASNFNVGGILSNGGSWGNAGTASQSQFGTVTALATDFPSPTFTNGFTYQFWFMGQAAFNNTGTFALSDRAVGFSHTIQAQSFMDVLQIA